MLSHVLYCFQIPVFLKSKFSVKISNFEEHYLQQVILEIQNKRNYIHTMLSIRITFTVMIDDPYINVNDGIFIIYTHFSIL